MAEENKEEQKEEQKESEVIKAMREKYEKDIEELNKKLADKDVVIKELINNPSKQAEDKKDEKEAEELNIDSYVKGVVGNIETKLKSKKKGM